MLEGRKNSSADVNLEVAWGRMLQAASGLWPETAALDEWNTALSERSLFLLNLLPIQPQRIQ
jgi:hypothetical protein